MTAYSVCSQPTENHSISVYSVYEKGEHCENLLLLKNKIKILKSAFFLTFACFDFFHSTNSQLYFGFLATTTQQAIWSFRKQNETSQD